MGKFLPGWARKPAHRQKVVATNKGWVVEATGEILTSRRGLRDRLIAEGYISEKTEVVDEPVVNIKEEKPVVAKKETTGKKTAKKVAKKTAKKTTTKKKTTKKTVKKKSTE